MDGGAYLPHESGGLLLRVGPLLHEALEELACSGVGVGSGLGLGVAQRARLQVQRGWRPGRVGLQAGHAGLQAGVRLGLQAGVRVGLQVRRFTSRDELHNDEPLALRLEDVLEGDDVRVAAHAAEDLHLVVRLRVGIGARVRARVRVRLRLGLGLARRWRIPT